MKRKIMFLVALALCMSAFLLPMTAYASTGADTTPPTVRAWITGEVLRIEATDADTSVEAVFINDTRFNYRVDGILEVSAKDNAGSGETISVYAIDFAGNKSDTVTISNPYYIAPAAPGTSGTETPSDGQAFTPDGTGTVVDDIVEQNGKEFFSITTAEGNVFYVIIDRYKDSENVYLLNAVTEDDLMALAEKSGDGNSGSAIPTPAPTETPAPTPSETEPPAEEPAKTDSGGNTGMMIFLVIAVLAVGGAGYYIKIVRPKQQTANDDEDEPEDEGYDEDYDFEDNSAENAGESDYGSDDEDYETEAEDEQ